MLKEIRDVVFWSIIIASLVTLIKASPVQVLNKNTFLYNNELHEINEEFILIQLIPGTSRGVFYFIDKDKTVIWSDRISAGAEPKYKTPSGIFKVYHKKEFWMSTKYPDPSGINNMDNSLFFKGGIALHQGSPKHASHGCVHVSKKYSKFLFKNSNYGTKVVVTRENYIKLLSQQEIGWLF